LYVAGVAWVIAGLLFTVILWPNDDDLTDGRGVALLTLAVCMLGATVSFGSGAVLHRMAMWQAAEVEAERG
jgi:hypothetical protein